MTTWDDIRADVFDSRQIIDALAEYDEETADDEEREEYARLERIAVELRSISSDWDYGETFIRDGYFIDYAQDLAEDIGAIPSGYSWPASHIDWDSAADALKQDYSCVTIEGTDYWCHA